jgi:hypothetical protein
MLADRRLQDNDFLARCSLFEERNLGIWARKVAKIKKLFKLTKTKHIGEF